MRGWKKSCRELQVVKAYLGINVAALLILVDSFCSIKNSKEYSAAHVTMSSSAGRRRSSRRHHRSSDMDESLMVVDVEQEYQGQNTCIDLTQEDEEVVDLTRPSVSDSPIVVLSPLTVPDSPSRRFRRHTRSSSEPEIVELPTHSIHTSPIRRAGSQSIGDVISPAGRRLMCPICMDGYTQIMNSRRQLNSTTCGHVFCNVCIRTAIQAQGNCPTCRKRIGMKQVHPLFV